MLLRLMVLRMLRCCGLSFAAKTLCLSAAAGEKAVLVVLAEAAEDPVRRGVGVDVIPPQRMQAMMPPIQRASWEEPTACAHGGST